MAVSYFKKPEHCPSLAFFPPWINNTVSQSSSRTIFSWSRLIFSNPPKIPSPWSATLSLSPYHFIFHTASPSGLLLFPWRRSSSTKFVDCRHPSTQCPRGMWGRAPWRQPRRHWNLNSYFWPVVWGGGAEGITEMTNFSPDQFIGILAGLKTLVLDNYNVGRDRNFGQTAEDVLFLVLAFLKHGGTQKFLAHIFGQKTSALWRMILRFIHLLSEAVYDHFVSNQTKRWSMKALQGAFSCVQKLSHGSVCNSCHVSAAFWPSRSAEEEKYYSGKHKIYGYKVEVSVSPNGFPIGSGMQEPESVSDLFIFQQSQWFHQRARRMKTP